MKDNIERESGYYWVVVNADWTIAHYYGSNGGKTFWTVMDSMFKLRDEDIKKIGDKIER